MYSKSGFRHVVRSFLDENLLSRICIEMYYYNLTSASFFGALTRFIDHRGRLSQIWSEGATIFCGNDLELRHLFQAFNMQWGIISNFLASEGIEWKFIPSSSPDFGRFWDTGVKSRSNHISFESYRWHA